MLYALARQRQAAADAAAPWFAGRARHPMEANLPMF
jgi:hypothetical protein